MRFVTALVAGTSFAVLLASVPALAQTTSRVSVDSSGAEADDQSYVSSISSDGRFVAFDSRAMNLVAGDTNNSNDVFVHDRATATTTRVSVTSAGVEGNGFSESPSISGDGRVIAFMTEATNFAREDFWIRVVDIYVHDRSTGTTSWVSVDPSGASGNAPSWDAAISEDGRFVTFNSSADNLVVGDTNRVDDIFVRDLVTATTVRASLGVNGAEGNVGSHAASISGDGRYVAFASDATNLVIGDTKRLRDIFVRDLVLGNTLRVSVDSSGNESNGRSNDPAISEDGRYVAFQSDASNLAPGDSNGVDDIFVHDLATATTTRVSVRPDGIEGNGASYSAGISRDGTKVSFASDAGNLVPGRDRNHVPDIFVHDAVLGIIEPVSVNHVDGGDANEGSDAPAISADGRFVSFTSDATNLIPGDGNSRDDIFVRDRCFSATWSNYGSGFPGTTGIPVLTSSADPVVGTTITVTLGNSYGAGIAALLLVGRAKASIPTALGGDLLVDPARPTSIIPLIVPAGGLLLPGTIPADPALCGEAVFLQALENDPGAAHGVSFTAGLELVIGT